MRHPSRRARLRSSAEQSAIKMTTVDDAHISVRFKHGIHTVYLLVDALAPLSAATEELLELLRERYPLGLTTRAAPPTKTPIAPRARLAYGVLKVATDPSKVWKRLRAGQDDEYTPTRCGIKDNSIVAFALLDDGDDDDEALFEVEWPKEDEAGG